MKVKAVLLLVCLATLVVYVSVGVWGLDRRALASKGRSKDMSPLVHRWHPDYVPISVNTSPPPNPGFKGRFEDYAGDACAPYVVGRWIEVDVALPYMVQAWTQVYHYGYKAHTDDADPMSHDRKISGKRTALVAFDDNSDFTWVGPGATCVPFAVKITADSGDPGRFQHFFVTVATRDPNGHDARGSVHITVDTQPGSPIRGIRRPGRPRTRGLGANPQAAATRLATQRR